jgi:hypothetical protein
MRSAYADLSRTELARLVPELLLIGQLIDRSGMAWCIARLGREGMLEVAIEEWMAASPIYTGRMQRALGYDAPEGEGDVVTIDDEKVGKVVGTQGDYLIVEQGTFRKSKHALPRTFTTVKEDEQVVCITLAKEILRDSPEVDSDFDQAAIADYYGLAEGSEELRKLHALS